MLDRYHGPQAGTERQILELAEGLRERGWQPGFVLLQRSEWLERRFPDSPIFTVGTSQLRSLTLWRMARRAAEWARSHGFRVAHIFLNDSALIFPRLLHAQGIVVFQARRDLGFWYTPLKLRALRMNRRWTTAVVANSRAVAGSVCRAEGYEPSDVRVIYNGLRVPAPNPAAAADVRRCLGLKAGDRLVVMVANLRPLKRPEDAVRAVASLRLGDFGDIHLALVGEDQDASQAQTRRLLDLAADLGAQGRIHCTGQVTDATPWVAAADVCLLCSETEGLSNAVIEYMLAGKPVVCTNVGGNPELITDTVDGRLVPVGDVPAITSGLADLLQNPREAARIAAAARARAADEFSVEAMLSAHIALYSDFKQMRAPLS